MKKNLLAVALLIIGAQASADPTDTHVEIGNYSGQNIKLELRYENEIFEYKTINKHSKMLVAKKNSNKNRLSHILAYGKEASEAINNKTSSGSPLLQVHVKRKGVEQLDNNWLFASSGKTLIDNTPYYSYIIDFNKKIDW